MIFVTSDLHGYPLNRFLALLDKAGFSDTDYLFVLGDVIDRGKDGVALLRWMAQQPNVAFILGNHEAFLLSCDFVFQQVTDQSLSELDQTKMNLLQSWMSNGADPTLTALRHLLKGQPDLLEGILDYLRDAPLFDEVSVNGRRFVLVHSGLGNFQPDKPLSAYTPDELLWTRPKLDTKYYNDATVIFGHTPTEFFGEQYRGKMLKTDTWICIDTGSATGNKPMLLRLDDMKPFYA